MIYTYWTPLRRKREVPKAIPKAAIGRQLSMNVFSFQVQSSTKWICPCYESLEMLETTPNTNGNPKPRKRFSGYDPACKRLHFLSPLLAVLPSHRNELDLHWQINVCPLVLQSWPMEQGSGLHGVFSAVSHKRPAKPSRHVQLRGLFFCTWKQRTLILTMCSRWSLGWFTNVCRKKMFEFTNAYPLVWWGLRS